MYTGAGKSKDMSDLASFFLADYDNIAEPIFGKCSPIMKCSGPPFSADQEPRWHRLRGSRSGGNAALFDRRDPHVTGMVLSARVMTMSHRQGEVSEQ